MSRDRAISVDRVDIGCLRGAQGLVRRAPGDHPARSQKTAMTRPDNGTTKASDAARETRGRQPTSSPGSGDTSRTETDGTATASRSDGGTATAAHEDLSVEEVRQRAVTGAAIDMLRGFGVRFIALIGTLVLARLLTPYDFGAIAIGTIFVTVGQFLADGGIGVGLIRRVDPPARATSARFSASSSGSAPHSGRRHRGDARLLRRVRPGDGHHDDRSPADGHARTRRGRLGEAAPVQAARPFRSRRDGSGTTPWR